jgi:hypothetical protein
VAEHGKMLNEQIDASKKVAETILVQMGKKAVEPMMVMYKNEPHPALLQILEKSAEAEKDLAVRRSIYTFISEAYLQKAKDVK